MVGPFAQYGREVVEACLAAGCHYLDTTGEQDWLIVCDERVRPADGGQGPAARARHRPDVHHRRDRRPALPGEAGRGHAGHPGLLEGHADRRLDPDHPGQRVPAKAYYLEQNPYVEWPADAGLYDVAVPGQHETGLALPWGGTSHPVWFKRDPRVANVKALGGVFNRPLMLGVPQIVAAVLAADRGAAGQREAPRARRARGRRR